MANNKIINDAVLKFCSTLNTSMGVIDDSKVIGDKSVGSIIKSNLGEIISCASLNDEPFILFGFTFLCPSGRPATDFIYFAEGEDKDALKNVQILNISLGSLKVLHDEKYDKHNFMKNVILDNVLMGDLILKAKELHIAFEAQRLVYLIKCSNASDYSASDILHSLYPDKNRDFVINIDSANTVLIKELQPDTTHGEINEMAQTILSTLNSEALIHAFIGIGTLAENLNVLAKSYKDACVALEVGKVFDTDKDIVNYDNLGVARLIYHLPTTLCEMFLNEVFKKESIDALDQETIYTIQKFFENNLNVSETSRQLYVHRNTLVYRLDKVQKITGLDLRIFEQAVVFKVAMMVKRYLVSNPVKL